MFLLLFFIFFINIIMDDIMTIKKISKVLKQNLTTIPKEIRNEFEIEEGTFIKWIINDDKSITIKPLKFME